MKVTSAVFMTSGSGSRLVVPSIAVLANVVIPGMSVFAVTKYAAAASLPTDSVLNPR